jgi:hypothetical protein
VGAAALTPLTPDIPVGAPTPAPTSKSRQHSIDRREQRVARYEQVLKLHKDGTSQRDISRQMKMSRTQVLKLLNADSFPERAAKREQGRQVDGYVEQLRARWDTGVRNACELAKYIATLGYTGSPDMVRRFVAPWRTDAERLKLSGSKPSPRSPVPLKLQRPASNRLSWLLLKEDVIPDAADKRLIEKLQEKCEPIRVGSDLARSFGDAVRKRDIFALTAWVGQALQTTLCKEMKGYAECLLRNWSEVRAAIKLPWSNGRAEGHVNRLKLIKRKMYGHAKLDLLRIRVLASGG